jgi:predicted extracellular nuclease
MLLNLSQTLYVTEIYNLGRYGEVWLSSGGRLWQPTQITTPGASAIAQQAANDLNRILLDDGSNTEDPDPIVYPAPGLSFVNTLRGGDSVTGLTGVLSYGYGYYLVEPTAVPAFIHANPRPAAPPVLGGRVKVMTYNLLNYFNGDGQGGGFPTSRGASTAEEFERQRIKIINGIVAAGPDVIGLMELENDGFGPYSAIQDLVNGLNEAAPSGTTYSFIDAGGPIGTDEIVVGIIYRIETMAPIGSPAILDSSVDPRFLDTKNRPALAQTFDEIMTGERFTVVVNHLKSKGSDCNDVGDPDTGDGQGNCNLTRLAAAQALVDWTLTDPTGSGDHDFFLMGDMNSYAMEDPIKAFEAGGYVNLHNVFESPVPYSYAFDGQWGTLDHILASASLMRQITRAATWHINSDEPIVLDYNMEYKSPDQLSDLYGAEPFRSSDHDPIIVGLFASADFSDLPASYGSAWHTGNGAVRLGIGWDNNPDSSDGADDATDDGVLRRPGVWAPRQRVIIQVKASKVGYLAAWFDWNDNGVFEAKEKAISKTVSKGSQLVALVVGADFNPSLHPNLRCRFRLYPSLPGTGVSPTGAAKGGEVEDYTWTFTFLSNVLDVSHTTSILMPDITAWISQKQ